jgi:hypothetical protein
VARELWKIAQEYQAEAAKLDNGRLSDSATRHIPAKKIATSRSTRPKPALALGAKTASLFPSAVG